MKYLQVPQTHKLEHELKAHAQALQDFAACTGPESHRVTLLTDLAIKGVNLVARLQGALAISEHTAD